MKKNFKFEKMASNLDIASKSMQTMLVELGHVLLY